MCTTIDGKILTKRWPNLPGNFDPSTLFESTADSLNIPAWLVGTTTMKEFAGRQVPLKRSPHPLPRTDYLAHLGPLHAGAKRSGTPRSAAPDSPRKPKLPTRFSIGTDARAAATLRLTSHKPLPHGVLWLRYKVLPSKR